MNIVNSGNKFVVYGEEVQTYKQLPANTYKVCFSPMAGFSLKLHSDLNVCERIYGNTPNKVKKVLTTFKKFNRNMGIILSGEKGSGKSVFARLLAEQGKELNLPLIIVDEAFNGIADFLESITQECIVLFDEFEKNFNCDDEEDKQDKLLSLFDGIDNGKKLYVLTCNRIEAINDYYLNRPGRFHYHFTFGVPTTEEIKEYLENNLNETAISNIPDILRLSAFANFTYDVLRAIVFELNNGYDLSETIQDLNIERIQRIRIRTTITLTGGVKAAGEGYITLTSSSYYDDLYLDCTTLPEELKCVDFDTDAYLMISFPVKKLSVTSDGMKINADDVSFNVVNSIKDEKTSEFFNKFMRSIKVEEVNFERLSEYESYKLDLL